MANEKNGSNAMNGISVSHIAAIVQGFVVFVAIATLMGRAYFITYMETLGIPNSEMRLHPSDYAAVSPDVAIYAVGLSTIAAVYLWSNSWQGIALNPPSARLVIGAGLGLCALALILYIIEFAWRFDNLNPGIYALVTLSPTAVLLTGGILLRMGLLTFSRVALRIAIMPVLGIILLCTVMWMSILFSSHYGEFDALRTVLVAPVAKIELDSSAERYEPQCSLGEYDQDYRHRYFKVILIGDRFVYLRPIQPKSPEEHLCALPIAAVRSILYISFPDDQ